MKYFFGFLAAVGLIVFVVVLIIRGFTGGSSKTSKNAIQLATYASTDVSVQMTVDGPITADQNHFGYRITVASSGNTIDLLQGYQNTVTSTKTYANNSDSYVQFLRAIDLLGYGKGTSDPKKQDSRGVCPDGKHFRFKILSGTGNEIQNYWTTSCGGGNFGGKREPIRQLFSSQIPDFDTLTNKLDL